MMQEVLLTADKTTAVGIPLTLEWAQLKQVSLEVQDIDVMLQH
jgi:hypothetical protein